VPEIRYSVSRCLIAGLGLLILTTGSLAAEPRDEAAIANRAKLTQPIEEGERVFTCGHSFHVWVPAIVTDLCKLAEIPNHKQLGISSIGGSRTIQHWDIPDEKNTAKAALKTGKVDVLTLSPIFLPDAGIENFVTLALEHNLNIRVIVPAHLAALGHLRANHEATHQSRSQRHHRRRAAKTTRGAFPEDGRAHPRTQQEVWQDGDAHRSGSTGTDCPA
jgi:hypothetical protein